MRYYWTHDGFKNRNGEPLVDKSAPYVPSMPMVIGDITPVANPVTGEMITSRSELRYQLDKHDKRIQEPSESPTQGKIRNEKFAKKRGLQVSKEYR